MTDERPRLIRGFEDLVRAHAATVDDFFFIQVGANDGINGDPLYGMVTELGWKGVLVEPQRFVYEQRLLVNYAGHDGLHFENVAIDEVDGERELFELSFSRTRWATGIASFERSHLQRHIDNGYVARMVGEDTGVLPEDEADYITSETVTTMTFGTLIDKYGIERLDLLQIDAEGYDHRLLQLYDFERLPPAIIQFEHHVMTEGQRRESWELLHRHGYLSFRKDINMFGIRRDLVEDRAIGFDLA